MSKTTKTATIRLLMDAGLTPVQIAANTGFNYDMVRGVVSRINTKIAKAVARAGNVEQEPEREPEVDRLKARVRRLEKTLKTAEQTALSEDEVRAKIFGLAAGASTEPRWMQDLATKGQGKTTGIPVTIWSDWHVPETVSYAETNGLNEFNMDIAEKRVTKLVRKTRQLCFEHMTNPDYAGIVVCLGGDMVSGEIHDELTDTNDGHLIPTVLKVATWIVEGLIALAADFGTVFCPCVDGNHGRNTFKIRNKSFRYKNFDWLIYNIVEREIKARGYGDRITFSIPPSNEVRFDVYDHRFLLLHGHDIGVRGGDGIIGALGPIKRGSIKVGAQQAEMGRGFDTLLLGHWHQYIDVHGIIVNPTLKGYDEFASKVLRATPQRAAQALFFVHPEYGITARWPVFVDEGKPKADSKPLTVWS
jgi:predicted phosphodiesterase